LRIFTASLYHTTKCIHYSHSGNIIEGPIIIVKVVPPPTHQFSTWGPDNNFVCTCVCLSQLVQYIVLPQPETAHKNFNLLFVCLVDWTDFIIHFCQFYDTQTNVKRTLNSLLSTLYFCDLQICIFFYCVWVFFRALFVFQSISLATLSAVPVRSFCYWLVCVNHFSLVFILSLFTSHFHFF
jgi:hypothetical protein